MKTFLDAFFEKENYIKLGSTLPEACLYFRMEMQAINVFETIFYEDNLYISEDELDEVSKKIPPLFESMKFSEVHVMILVVCRDEEKALRLVQNKPNAWILNSDTGVIIVPQGHREEFYGIRHSMEEALKNPNFAEEAKALSKDARAESPKTGVNPFGKSKYRVPWVTISLVSLNVIVFIVYQFIGNPMYNRTNVNWYSVYVQGEYYRLITAMFMHADVQHLFNNMLMIFLVGEIIETHIGHLRTFLYYMVSGIGAAIASAGYAYYIQEYITSVGASGAYFGMMGVLLVLFCLVIRTHDRGLIFRLLLMIGLSIYSGLKSQQVDNAAHIGGFVVGLTVSFLAELIIRFVKIRKAEHRS